MSTVKRRNLSGMYIFHKFEDEQRREPTCFEDGPENVQDEWLNKLEPEAVKNVAKSLAGTLRRIGDTFEIAAAHSDIESE